MTPSRAGSIPAPPAKVVEILAQIRSQHFTAGIVLWDGVVIEAAPILHYMKKQKWSRDRVRDYCKEKGWTISVITQVDRYDTRYKPV